MARPFPKPDEIVSRHPLSAIWGDLETEDFDVLLASVKKNGLLHPITLYEGEVLDGWQRMDACAVAGIEPRYQHFEDAYPNLTPIQYVLAENSARRHLTKSQLALVIAKTSEWKPKGRPKADSKASAAPSTQEMAKEVGVSPRTIKQAKKVIGTPEEEAVAKGEKSVQQAAKDVSAAAEKDDPASKPPEVVVDLNATPDWDLKTYKRKYSKILDQIANFNQLYQRALKEKAALENKLSLYQEKEAGVTDDLLKTFSRLQSEAETAESNRRHWMRKYNEAERENRRLRKLLREKGVQIKR